VHRDSGTRTLVAEQRGRRLGKAGKLSTKQSERMRALIVGKMPEQLKLHTCGWTRATVRELLKRARAWRWNPLLQP
jgi:hypothetical protein